MKSIYIVSTVEKSNNDEYKIGRHTGTKKKY